MIYFFNSNKELFELISKFHETMRYKINIQILVVFLDSNSELLEKEM